MNIHAIRRALWLALLLPLFAPGVGRIGRQAAVAASGPAPHAAPPQAQRLTSDSESELQGFLYAAELSNLRWPDFENYAGEVREFYGSYGGALAWVRKSKPTPQARAIIELLKNAESKGLNPEDYDGGRWDARLASFARRKSPTESELVRFDLAITVSAMRYVSDLHIGRVSPRLLHFEFENDHGELDMSEFVRQRLVDAPDVKAAIETVEPPYPSYRRTLAALQTYLELARRDTGELLPVPRKPVKPGDSYSGVARLARLLKLVEDLPHNYQTDASATTYHGAVVDAVKHFQMRHGLEPNGQLDERTLKELNTPLSRRVLQLKLTLERWRWLPNGFKPPMIVVNIPEFRLRVVDEEFRWALSMNVVVGRAYRDQTPVFTTEMKSVVFRPYWNVPLAIQRTELLPEIEKNSAYLAKNAYEIVDAKGAIVSTDGITDEMKEALRTGTLMIRQRPGPENSLGLLKFDMPNSFDVYMHDTPATQLFARSRRDFSHGCIRVEDPVALADWALRDQPEWTEEKIRAAMNGDATFHVNLRKPVPVLIVYGTAFVMEDAEVRFFDDIYGNDAALEEILSRGYPYWN
ncbi:MAG: L,D-transpeptidase family protein [Candidatus Acidiferrales bacterium]